VLEHRRREPAPGVFRLVLPLPWPGLDRVNAYLLEGPDGCTLVDAGMFLPDDDGNGWDDVEGAFAATGHSPKDVSRLVITHTHIDHYGMAGRFVAESRCELVAHPLADRDIELYQHPEERVRRLRELFTDHGVAESELDELTQFEDWRRFISDVALPTSHVDDGDTISVGDRKWQVVYTPGHSENHICLWSATDRLLISGDHLLPTITPHIDYERHGEKDPLGDFLESLVKVEKLDPAISLPGHGGPFEEGAERARIVVRHHERRLGSILQVVRREAHTAEQITQEIFGSTLLNFQKRLALGEALAHIRYLSKRGEIERVKGDDGTWRYTKASRKRVREIDDS
jgi:glyoxylase-like metal-dependent hydrolase (beta-lactamase superfamily II)